MQQRQLVDAQFSGTAAAYLDSAVHARGADLERLQAVGATSNGAGAGGATAHDAATNGVGAALDLGCGAGHASFALARGGVRRVVAYDLSAAMLEVVAREAGVRGLGGIETRLGSVESLPFAANSFDLVVTRFSAHHWLDVPLALGEATRVLKPDGKLIVIDVVAPETALFDTILQTVELLRDAAHVRNYRVSEWTRMLTAAGQIDLKVDCWKIALEFDSWVRRIATPAARIGALHAVFAALPAEAHAYFEIGADHSFSSDVSWIESTKPA